MEIEATRTTKIIQCYNRCPYFALDDAPNPKQQMRCRQPDAPDSGYIIFHPDCVDGFPKKCPLTSKILESKTKIADTIIEAVKLFTAHNGKEPTMLNIGERTWGCLQNQSSFIILASDTFLGMRIFITSHFEGFTVCTFK